MAPVKLKSVNKPSPLRTVVRFCTWFCAAVAPLQAAYEFIDKSNLPWVGTALRPRLLDITGAVCEMAGIFTIAIPTGTLVGLVFLGSLLYLPLIGIAERFFPWVDTEDWISWLIAVCIALPSLLCLYLVADSIFHPSTLMDISYSKAESRNAVQWWFFAAIGAVFLFYAYAKVFMAVKQAIKENIEEDE